MKKLIYLVPTLLIIVAIFIVSHKRKEWFNKKDDKKSEEIATEKYSIDEEEIEKLKKDKAELIEHQRELAEKLNKANDSIYVLNKRIERIDAEKSYYSYSLRRKKSLPVAKNDDAKKIKQFFVERYDGKAEED